jgi:hypothetical protein
VHSQQPSAVGELAVAEHDAGQVHGEQAAPAEERRDAEGEAGEGQHRRRIQSSRRQPQPPEESASAEADRQPPEGADDHLHRDAEQHLPAARPAGRDEARRQHRREDHGHRVVDSGLHLERDADAPLEMQRAPAQDGEDRRRVGRRDDRAKQEGVRPLEADPARPDGDQPRRPDDADGGQHRRGAEIATHRGERRVQTAVEENEDERDRPQPVREAVILEGDPADPLGAGEDADDEEDEQHRDTDLLRRAAEDDADREERPEGDEQERGRAGLRRHRAGGSLDREEARRRKGHTPKARVGRRSPDPR